MVKCADLDFLPTLFDEKYLRHIYFEDSDLCLRLKNRDLQIGELDIDCEHKHSSTMDNEKIRIDARGALLDNQRIMQDRWTIPRKENRPIKILVKRKFALGDILCCGPILRELSYKYPASEITMQADIIDPLAYCGLPIKLIPTTTPLNDKDFDRVIDLWLAYENRPLMHMIDAYAQEARVVLTDKVPRYDPNLKWNGKKNFRILVSAEGSWASRTLDINKWRNIIKEISLDGDEIIEIGNNTFLGVGENRCGQYRGADGIHKLAELMCDSGILLCMDGFLMHLAQSVGLPVMAIFGCIYPGYRIHDWSKAKVIWLDQSVIPCAGCHHLRPSPRTFTQCEGGIDCLTKITEQQILDCYYNQDFGNKPRLHIRDWKGYMR